MHKDRMIEVEKYGKSAQGKQELLKHLSGKKLTMLQAIKAKCNDCMGNYSDGKVDCQIPGCPLYPWMSYKEGGRQLVRQVSEETRKAIKKRMAKRRPQNQVKAG